jgi:phage replication-related protein YjqB (UPF0714/DUF867 family)
MGTNARKRLGTTKEFAATVTIPVPHPDPNYTDEEAEEDSEFVERLVDDDDNAHICIVSPHGGTIETRTDREAERITAALHELGVGCSSWICKGWKQGGGSYVRWHITSTDLSPNSFPGLAAIQLRKFSYCVSFHGMSDPGVLIGGAADDALRQLFCDAIADALSNTSIEVRLATEDDPLNGNSPKNVVNWLTKGGSGGVQIEQSMLARIDHWEAIADAVTSVCKDLDLLP